MSRKLRRYEQETIILWNNDENTCRIDTCDLRLLNKLRKLASKYPDSFKKLQSDERYASYQCSKRLVSVRAPYSELRRQQAHELALQQKRVPPLRIKNSITETEESNG